MNKENQVKDKICPPCDYYLESSGECRLLLDAGDARTREIFEGKRCDPLKFVRSFVTRYVSEKYGSQFANEIEDIVSEITFKLRNFEPEERFLADRPKDILHFRRWLVAFARSSAIEHFRKTSRTDPAGGAPARNEADLQIPTARTWRRALSRTTEMELEELIFAIMGRLEKTSLRMAIAIRKLFFDNQTIEEIARDLGVSVRTVTRDVEKGLALLRILFAETKSKHLHSML